MEVKSIRKYIDLICISFVFVVVTVVMAVWEKDFSVYEFFVFVGKNNNILQLISSSVVTQFVHFDFWHLVSNIVFAFYISKEASKYISLKRKTIVAIMGGISVSCSLMLFAQAGVEYVGASGWLGAVMGAVLVDSIIFHGKKIIEENKNFVYVSLLFVILSAIVPSISFLMHISGLLTGIVIESGLKYIKIRKG